MLKYTFSNREKALIAILAFVLLGVFWYQFVFRGVQDQVASIESQIAAAQDQIPVDQALIQRKSQMEASVAQFKAQGFQPQVIPAYDNASAVMDQLYGVLNTSNAYNLNFDELAWTDEGQIARGVTLSFGANSYAEAKNVLMQLYQGDYPCQIDSLAIVDNSWRQEAATGTSTSSSPVAVTAHFVYLEEVTDNSPTKGLPARPASSSE